MTSFTFLFCQNDEWVWTFASNSSGTKLRLGRPPFDVRALLLIHLGYGCPRHDRRTCERYDTPPLISLHVGGELGGLRIRDLVPWGRRGSWGIVGGPEDPFWSPLI